MTNLQRERKKRGFTQEELAKLSDVPVSTLRKYEQEKLDINKTTVDVVKRLAKALKCKVDDIIE